MSVFWIDVLVTGRGGRLVVLVRVPKFTFGTGSAASTSEVTLAEGGLPRQLAFGSKLTTLFLP